MFNFFGTLNFTTECFVRFKHSVCVLYLTFFYFKFVVLEVMRETKVLNLVMSPTSVCGLDSPQPAGKQIIANNPLGSVKHISA